MGFWIRYDLSRHTWEISSHEKENIFSDLIENFPREVGFGKWVEFDGFADARVLDSLHSDESQVDKKRIRLYDDGDLRKEVRRRRAGSRSWGPSQVDTTPAVSTAGKGRLYFDRITNRFKASENAGVYKSVIQTASEVVSTAVGDIVATDVDAAIAELEAEKRGLVMPSCHVYNTGNQTISNNTQTDLTFDSEDHDNAAMHSTGSNTDRVTIPSNGIYCFGAHLIWDANATGDRQTHITLNDAAPVAVAAKLVRSDILPTAHLGNFAFHQLSSTRQLVAGDILRVSVIQTSGGNLNIFGTTSGGPSGTSFWCFKVSD